ncbi:MAG: allantoinase AllB [Synergistales bacterium]|nr:allantoinase AllB [Synergistales bacterium]
MQVELRIDHVDVVTEGGVFPGAVAVDNGRVVAIGKTGTLPEAETTVDGQGLCLLPGGVDPHVHIRYPGGAHRETFATGTAAAAAGGVATVVEHPISTPPQYSVEILMNRVEAVREQARVDVAFLGAAGGETLEHIPRIARQGIVGYKTFLHEAPEGRDKEFVGLTSKDNHDLRNVLQQIGRTGLPAAAHGEDNAIVAGNIAAFRKAGATTPMDHARSRPPIVEVLAVQRLISLAREAGAPLYLVHISTPEAVEMAARARRKGQEITIETCPHYLYLTEEALEEHGAYAKCNPALRDAETVERLWRYVEDGTIDSIGSDHAPYTVEEKERGGGDIFVPPAGFPGLETRLPLLLDAVHRRRISLQRAVELLSTNPARAYGLYPRKGAIRVGADADFVLVNPGESSVVERASMHTMARDVAKVYEGWRLYGRVHTTFVRGRQVFGDGVVTGEPGYGTWVAAERHARQTEEGTRQ